MKNRSKGAVLSVVFTLLLSLFLPTSYSAQKITTGAPCKGLNKKVDYKNKTYPCTLTIEGIRIKVVGTGDYETIEISKVGQAGAEKYPLLYPPPP